ncbi:hypothetical protein ATZ33_08340 [Enterococcus silesiacus]|uniref:Uncharacterized protein n=1 Tax=Enterococcus silesiacus TaxID=332949 RepID=A0ABN4J645_9ENTE|nr:hypothetical protein [Enterococcus silesiacus]ALS01373.1 hypothetical protein ATZ33_08340 [Enterococcus silesiacus]
MFPFLLFVHFNFIDMRKFLYVYDEETYFSKSNFENEINEKVTFFFYETKKNYPENPFIKKIVEGNEEDAVINQLCLMIYSILLQTEKRQPQRVKVYIHNSKVYIADILKGIVKKIF